MASTIKLNYEISNVKAASTTDPEKYLVVIDESNKKTFKLPSSLIGKYKNVTIGDERKKV